MEEAKYQKLISGVMFAGTALSRKKVANNVDFTGGLYMVKNSKEQISGFKKLLLIEVSQDKGIWFVKCPELGIGVQGKTPLVAFQRFGKQLVRTPKKTVESALKNSCEVV